jgi:hypothetical protein
MGKIVMDTDNIISSNINNLNSNSMSEYSRYIEGKPTMTTYFNQNMVNTTYDKGTLNVERSAGSNSSIVFNKINKLPIFNIDGLSLNTDYDENGISSSMEAEGIIVPDTIKPLVNDLFLIDYLSDKLVFKITAVSPDTIRNKPFYKISFKLIKKLDAQATIDEYLAKNIKHDFTFLYENIGTSQKSILESSTMLDKKQLDIHIESLIDRYKSMFLDKTLNIVCMWFNDRLHPLFTHEVEKNKRLMLQLHYSLDAERERAGTKTCERIRNNGTA